MKKKQLALHILLTLILLIVIYGFTAYSLDNYNTKPVTSNEVKKVQTVSDDDPVVYFTKNISSEGLMNIYHALGKEATGNVAIKLHTGEPGGHYYLSPDLIENFVKSVNGTIVECNTAYGGDRSTTAMHLQVAEDHGFTAIADVDIMDANGYISLPVTGGTHLTENFVGANFENYDFFVILSHFKGHAMGGFGGAVKNMSIGIAASMGKSWIHSSGTATTGFMGNHNDFLESMAEAASSVADKLGDNIIYINVMNNLSVDCDCMSHPAAPTMSDIGILASLDPVALDQACVDLVYAADDSRDLINRIESLDGIHTLEHAIDIGFGSRSYTLESIDAASVVHASKTDNVTVYPNPVSSSLTIPNYKNYSEVQVVDMNGKLISKHKCQSVLNLEFLKKGNYILQFVIDGQVAGKSLLIKE